MSIHVQNLLLYRMEIITSFKDFGKILYYGVKRENMNNTIGVCSSCEI